VGVVGVLWGFVCFGVDEMKIFDVDDGGIWLGKVNFIDENNVLLGYDLEQDCCEFAGFFMTHDSKWYEKKRPEKSFEQLGNVRIEIKDYVFDPDYFQERTLDGESQYAEFKAVDMNKGAMGYSVMGYGNRGYPPIYIVLFNVHNGYYSHGFKFGDKEGSL
jgi:hypothetical protein